MLQFLSSLDVLSATDAVPLADAQALAWNAVTEDMDFFTRSGAAVMYGPTLNKAVADMYASGRVIVKGDQKGAYSLAQASQELAAEMPADTSAENKQRLVNGLTKLYGQGYRVVGPAASTPAPATATTTTAVVQAATTPKAKAEPVTVNSMQAATDLVKAYAPLMQPIAVQRTATELLKAQQTGTQLYRPSRNTWMWASVGIGAVIVIGLLVYFATRE